MKNRGYAKFGRERGEGGNKVHYGKCKSGVLKDVLLYLGISERGWEKM